MLRLISVSAFALMLGACAAPSQNTVQLAQERQACAELGFDPAGAPFASCVGNLDSTMVQYRTPAAW